MGTKPESTDLRWMQRALSLARRGLTTTHPNPRVGCVITRHGQLVGEGWHRRAGEAHAEIHALQAAGAAARGATVYVTLEPCCHHGRTPPCADALIAAGVERVVIATQDPNPIVRGRGVARLQQAGITVETGLCEAGCRQLNRGFHHRHEWGRPWVTVKQGQTLDGRVAASNGTSRWITGDAARRDVHRLRAAAGCVLTGIGTVLADDPLLTVRLRGQWQQPLRIVLDRQLRILDTAKLLNDGERTLIFTESNQRRHFANTVEVQRLPQLTPGAVLAELAQRDINEVLVEAGPILSGAFLASGLVNEWLGYVAPSMLGDAARGSVVLPLVQDLADCLRFQITSSRKIGDDLRISATPLPQHAPEL